MTNKEKHSDTDKAAEVDTSAAATPQSKEASQEKAASSGGRKAKTSKVKATAHDDQLNAAVEEAQVWKEKAMRAQAEFDNTRKRLEAQQVDALRRASERVIAGLLPIVDDLERAAIHSHETDNELASGLDAIDAKFEALFANEGVTIISPHPGEAFDHGLHQAVQMVERSDLPDQSIAEVLQKGYAMGTRVIRPAVVLVATTGK